MNQELHNAKCYFDGKPIGVADVTVPSFHIEFDLSAFTALFGVSMPKPSLYAIVYQFSKS